MCGDLALSANLPCHLQLSFNTHVSAVQSGLGLVGNRFAICTNEAPQGLPRIARQASHNPEFLLRPDTLSLLQTICCFRNDAADQPEQPSLDGEEIHFGNVSNQRAEGKAVGCLQGILIGSGDTAFNLTFRPEGGDCISI